MMGPSGVYEALARLTIRIGRNIHLKLKFCREAFIKKRSISAT